MVYRFEGGQLNSEILRYGVIKKDLTLLTQADVSAISLAVYDVSTSLPTTPAGDVTLQVTDCILTTAVNAKNVVVVVDGSYFPLADRTYRIQVKITPANNGTAFYLGFVEKKTDKTYGV